MVHCPSCGHEWEWEYDMYCVQQEGIVLKCCHTNVEDLPPKLTPEQEKQKAAAEERAIATDFWRFGNPRRGVSALTDLSLAIINAICLASSTYTEFVQLEVAFPVYTRLFWSWNDDPARFYNKYGLGTAGGETGDTTDDDDENCQILS